MPPLDFLASLYLAHSIGSCPHSAQNICPHYLIFLVYLQSLCMEKYPLTSHLGLVTLRARAGQSGIDQQGNEVTEVSPETKRRRFQDKPSDWRSPDRPTRRPPPPSGSHRRHPRSAVHAGRPTDCLSFEL
jgi:hypothetical protein